MRYVICHGELPRDGTKVFASRSRVGVYVARIGEPLPQSAVVGILSASRAPTQWLDQKQCPDVRLMQLDEREYQTLTQAAGPHLTRTNPYLVPRPMTLSQLVAELNEDELRLITCTVTEGAPREPTTVEVVGVRLTLLPPTATRQPEDDTAGHQLAQLVYKRQRSAGAAAEYLASLTADDRGRIMLKGDKPKAVVWEWMVDRTPEITTDIGTWVDTVWYVVGDGGLARSMTMAWSSAFPGFCDGVRARLDAINGHLAAWPACVGWLKVVYSATNDSDQRIGYVRRYLEAPVGTQARAVRGNVQRFTRTLQPVQRLLAGLGARDLAAWHTYLSTVASLGSDDLAGLRLIANVDGTPDWMAGRALEWTDFNDMWNTVVTSYPETIAPVLRQRGAINPRLRERISGADAMRRLTLPVYADAMDFGPDTGGTSETTAPSRLPCPRCRRDTAHRAAVPDALRGYQGVRVCAVCRQLIPGYADPVAFTCETCGGVTLLHADCRR